VAWHQTFFWIEFAMTKKALTGVFAFLLGAVVVWMVVQIAASGYDFGQYLASLKSD
jgi:hypothetical protein